MRLALYQESGVHDSRHVGDNIPQVKCVKCKVTMPVTAIKQHMLVCPAHDLHDIPLGVPSTSTSYFLHFLYFVHHLLTRMILKTSVTSHQWPIVAHRINCLLRAIKILSRYFHFNFKNIVSRKIANVLTSAILIANFNQF